jgi:hypothetical protein
VCRVKSGRRRRDKKEAWTKKYKEQWNMNAQKVKKEIHGRII